MIRLLAVLRLSSLGLPLSRHLAFFHPFCFDLVCQRKLWNPLQFDLTQLCELTPSTTTLPDTYTPTYQQHAHA